MNGAFGAAAAGLGLVLGASLLGVQERPDSEHKEPLSEFMNRKLAYAEQALDGLSRRDAAAVAAAADRLGLLCLDLDWNVIQSDEYVERSATFRRTSGALAKAAREQKLERAELAYLDLVGQCFSCHAFVRDHRSAR